MKKRTKTILLIVLIFIIIWIVFVPDKWYCLDGGSVSYKALAYEVWNYNSLDGLRGTTVEIFGILVYDGRYWDLGV